MSIGSFEAAQPLSSEELNADLDRHDDVEKKHQRVCDFLKARQYEAFLIQRPANFAWFTSGGVPPQLELGEAHAGLFITPDSRLVACNNLDSSELFEKQIPGLGFLVKERPWHEGRDVLFTDLCRGRKMASDTGYGKTADESKTCQGWRVPLQPVEWERMKEVARLVTHAVEATARTVQPGETESEIAGQLAHRLVKHLIVPMQLRVVADDRGRQHRHWHHGEAPVRRWCTIAAVGSRWGLSCGAARTICFGNPADDLAATYQQAAMLQATGLYFSQAGIDLGTLWEKVRRIYEKLGRDNEAQTGERGSVIGYQVSEIPITPKSEIPLAQGMAVHWHCSLDGVSLGDTILVGDEGGHVLTKPEQWPTLRVAVKGQPVSIPDMLCREPGNASLR